MKKPIHNYILLVDAYRRPSRQHNTHGRYRVGAKSPKEATDLLRAAIGFGSIQVYYECDNIADKATGHLVGYQEIVKEVIRRKNDKVLCCYMPVHHANDPYESYANAEPIRILDY